MIKFSAALQQLAAVTLATSGLAQSSNIQDLLPLQKGYVVATCFSSSTAYDFLQDPNGPVVLVFDATAPELAAAGTNLSGGTYAWRRFHNEVAVQNPGSSAAEEWRAGNLGEVFGTTLDDNANPNIYVAATTAYGVHPYPAGNHSGTVYRLDGTTGVITPFNCIPAGQAGLGNLTFWRASGGTGHLYVSNLDDGLIYQLDLAGDCVGTYDHGVAGRTTVLGAANAIPDTGANYTPVGRRIWGLEAHEGRLYYGVWNATSPEVWSVALDATGAPLAGTAQIDVTAGSYLTNYPISDIAFSATGQLYTAHRYHRGVPFGYAHQASVYEFSFAAGSWDNPSPANQYRVGNYTSGGQNRNSAGGVDVDCVGAVWATGDAINFGGGGGGYIYGAQRIPPGGNPTDSPATLNSHVIDFDDNISAVLKNYMGDIEAYDPCAECFDITDLEIECPKSEGDPYLVSFKITNRSDRIAHYIWHTPCPQDELPDGGITGQPLETGPQPLPGPLAPGDCTTVTVSLPAPNTGGKFCWTMTLLDESGEECCTDKFCLDLPDCDCLIVLDKSIECVVSADGTIKYVLTIKLLNTSNFPWYHVNLLPPGPFIDATFDLSANPVPPGGTYDLSTCVTGQPNQKVAFHISVHNQDIDECCSRMCCVVIPECEDGKPDGCEVTQMALCCPNQEPGAPPVANAVLTICNNSPVSRTYSWVMNPLPPGPGCTGVLGLGSAAFSPPSGLTTVGPNSCVNIPIQINCEGLEPGQRACYEACVREQDNPENNFCCEGRVFAPQQPNPVIKDDPDGDPVGALFLSPRRAVSRNLHVSNPSDQPVRLVFDVRSRGDFIEIASPQATTSEVNTLKRFAVDLEPFETEIVALQLRATDGVPFDNTVIPIMIYPLAANGEVTRTTTSILAIAPAQRPGAPALKGLARNPDGTFTMVLQTNPGRTYRIESSETLGGVEPWAAVACSTVQNGQQGTEFLAETATLILLITPDPSCPRNFFRAVELP